MKKRLILFLTITFFGLAYFSISSTFEVKDTLKEKVIKLSQTEEAVMPLHIFDIFSVYLK